MNSKPKLSRISITVPENTVEALDQKIVEEHYESRSQAIVDMLAHPERWPLMKANGREFVESVRNWRNSVANYQAPYESILDGSHA